MGPGQGWLEWNGLFNYFKLLFLLFLFLFLFLFLLLSPPCFFFPLPFPFPFPFSFSFSLFSYSRVLILHSHLPLSYSILFYCPVARLLRTLSTFLSSALLSFICNLINIFSFFPPYFIHYKYT